MADYCCNSRHEAINGLMKRPDGAEVIKMMNFVLKMMNFVFKMMNFVLKMMNVFI